MELISGLKHLLSDVAIYAASLGVFVGGVDFFLSDKQRESLNNLTLKAWLVLADMDPMKRLARLRSRKLYYDLLVRAPLIVNIGINILLFIAVCVLQIMISSEQQAFDSPLFVESQPNYVANTFLHVVVNISITGICCFVIARAFSAFPRLFDISYAIYDFTLSGKSALFVLLKVFASTSIYILILSLLVITSWGLYYVTRSDILMMIISFVFLCTVIPVIGVVFVANAFFWTTIWVSILSITLLICETTVRKIAEYDKGAVLGASMALGAIGTVLKGFE